MRSASIPCAVIHSDTHVATAVAWKSAAARQVADVYRERYLATAATMLADCGSCLHLLVDVTPREGDQPTARRVIMVPDGISMARFMENMGNPVKRHDALIVLPPDVREPALDSDEFREQVATDLAYILERLYPLQGKGPIAPMLPWLTRLAGAILLFGHRSPEDGAGRARRATARHLAAGAMESFDSWNARAEFLTAYPSWPYLAEEVAHAATMAAATLVSGLTMEAAAAMVRGVMAQAMENLDLQSPSKAA